MGSETQEDSARRKSVKRGLFGGWGVFSAEPLLLLKLSDQGFELFARQHR